MYVDKKLTPLDRDKWIDLNKDESYWLIKKSNICVRSNKEDYHFEVITVWVGYDKDKSPKGKIRPFGTRVFYKNFTKDLADFQLKSFSEEEALILHDRTCKEVEKGIYIISDTKESKSDE